MPYGKNASFQVGCGLVKLLQSVIIPMVQATAHCHIVRDDQILRGEPIIQGTRTPVRAIVETWKMGVIAEEIIEGMPHLSLSQIFDALSYYLDNQGEINQYIEKNKIPEDRIHPLVKDL